jgi:hypothetical protein
MTLKEKLEESAIDLSKTFYFSEDGSKITIEYDPYQDDINLVAEDSSENKLWLVSTIGEFEDFVDVVIEIRDLLRKEIN